MPKAEKKYYYGTGRRKNAIARVRLIEGTGKIIVNELIEGQLMIRVLHPVNFDDLQTKEMNDIKGNSFHFYFEKPNIIYYGVKDNESTKIKIKFLLPEERNIFYMNEID